MLVRLCDSCELVLGPTRPCVAVALRKGGTLALRTIPEGGTIPPQMSAHFCSPQCAKNWIEQWLLGLLPETTVAVEVEAVTVKRTAEVIPIAETTEWPPRDVPRRQATPQEIADQQAVLGAVLGGE